MSHNHNSPYADTKIIYTACPGGCGSGSQCVFKAHFKDGTIVAVEPDDRYNANVGREDGAVSERELTRVHLQRRPCTKGLVFHKYASHPDRILYPLKRAEGTRRGEGKYVRISWEEALTTIADKMMALRAEYGPYSIMNPFPQLSESTGLGRLLSLWGAGVDGWGWSSYDSIRLMSHLMAGVPATQPASCLSGSAADMLANARLIVLWGYDPGIGSFGPGQQFGWFLKLAREKGTKVIIIDPRYTVAAEVLADQWLPIKPGTDIAMFLAIAHVLIKENLFDKEFVAEYVEPAGFEKWRRYLFGEDDGIEKSPEWAEKRCAVPARTIRELASLIAATKPSWLWSNWAVSRKSRGESAVKAFAALQALLGYWGTPGAGPSFNLGPSWNIPIHIPWGERGHYRIPKLYRGHYWAQAILLLDKVRSSELAEEEYMRMVGWRAEPSLIKDFNPKMLIGATAGQYSSNFLVSVTDSPNDQIKALDRLEFTTFIHTTLTPTVKYGDVILPVRDSIWEEKNIVGIAGQHGFGCINYCAGAAKPPGEAKSWVWIYVKLAENLGLNPREYFNYYTTDENWEEDWDRYIRAAYQKVADYYKQRDILVPAWEQFTQGSFINCDELEKVPFTGWDEQIKDKKPFQTASGKIEIYSEYIANEANKGKGEHRDSSGNVYEVLPSDWGSLAPMPVFEKAVGGMDDPRVSKYPLMLLSPHPRYRIHSFLWNHPWLRDHVYRHRVWLSLVDAKARGIRDNDIVRVYNDRGQLVMPAYVTARLMPGIVIIHHGAWYLPDKRGIDFGASPSTLLGGDFESGTIPAKTTGLVEVEKYQGRR